MGGKLVDTTKRMGYTIIAISHNPNTNKFEYKYSDRYDTYFKTFHDTLSHQECVLAIEKQLQGIAIRKHKEKELDRTKYIGAFSTIEYEVE